MADHIRVAVGIDRHLPNGQTLAELDQPALRYQARLARLAQEVEGQVCGNGEPHRPDLGKDSHIKRQIRQGHHGGAGNGSARTDQLFMIVAAQAGAERTDCFDMVGPATMVDLRELALQKGVDFCGGHLGHGRTTSFGARSEAGISRTGRGAVKSGHDAVGKSRYVFGEWGL